MACLDVQWVIKVGTFSYVPESFWIWWYELYRACGMRTIHPCLSKQDTSSTILYYPKVDTSILSFTTFKIRYLLSKFITDNHWYHLCPFTHMHRTPTPCIKINLQIRSTAYILDQCKVFTFIVFSHVTPHPLGNPLETTHWFCIEIFLAIYFVSVVTEFGAEWKASVTMWVSTGI